MNRLKFFAVILLSALISSCSGKLDSSDNIEQFVGKYSVTITQNVVWGGSSSTLTDSGTMTIQRSGSGVKVTGFISTTGRVIGNTLYLDTTTSSDSNGTITTTFSSAMLMANMLRITGHSSGQLKYNGRMYAYSSTDNITARKIN